MLVLTWYVVFDVTLRWHYVTSPLCPSSSLSFSSSLISTSAWDLERWRPNPDSHDALLWHRLMGPVVLKVMTTADGAVWKLVDPVRADAER